MKRLLRNIFQRFGYDIIKTDIPYIAQTRKNVDVKVGKFTIKMPGNNIQWINYKIYPDLNNGLGRLSLTIAGKYSNMAVIDVGANVGDTIAIIKSFIDIPIIGVEGDDTSFQFLEKNSQQFSNVRVYKSFLGEKAGNMSADLGSLGWNTTIMPSSEGGNQVSVRTLDDLVNENKLGDQNIKLLKVDVEGFDTLVLRGASEIIKNRKPVLFFEYNQNLMKKIKEDGISTIFSFNKYGYNKIAFFDHKGGLVLATTLANTEVVQYLNDYSLSSKNLIGYYDIAIFHEQDNDIAEQYLSEEKKYL